MDARDELREEVSAMREAVRILGARFEAASEEIRERRLELDALREAVEQLKAEMTAISHEPRQPQREQIIFDHLGFSRL